MVLFFIAETFIAGVVAQLEEHLLCKQGVTGSSPVGSTMIDKASSAGCAMGS